MVNYLGSLDRAFAALADPTRRAILARLALGESRVTDLAEPFDMSLPAVSKHIRVLEGAGLVARTVDGRIHRCALAPEPLHVIEHWLDFYRGFWSETLDAVARHAEREKRR